MVRFEAFLGPVSEPQEDMQKQLCQSNMAPSIWWFQLWSIRHVPKHSTNTNLTLLGILADGGAAGVRLVSKSPHEHARFQLLC